MQQVRARFESKSPLATPHAFAQTVREWLAERGNRGVATATYTSAEVSFDEDLLPEFLDDPRTDHTKHDLSYVPSRYGK